MGQMNEQELNALEDSVVQDEVIRIWSSDTRFTSLSADEMATRVTNYWIRKAGSTLDQKERIDYFFKGIQYLTGPIGGIAGTFKNPALDSLRWLSKKFGGNAHRIAIEAATKSISEMSSKIGYKDFHAFLRQTNLASRSFELYKNAATEYQPMILESIIKDILLTSATVTNGFTHSHGETITEHDQRLKSLGAQAAQFNEKFKTLFSDQKNLQQAVQELKQGKGVLAEFINNQVGQFHEVQQQAQYVYEQTKNQEKQAAYNEKLKVASNVAGLAIDVTSFLIGDVLGDHQTAQRISQVGGNLIGLGLSVASCAAPTPPSLALCVTGIAGSFFGLVRSIFGSHGEDPMQTIFKMMKDMAKDIKNVLKKLDKIEKFLEEMSAEDRKRFKVTLEYLEYIATQVSELRTDISGLRQSINWMTQEQYVLFQASAKFAYLKEPVEFLKRSLQKEGGLQSNFIEKYFQLLFWPKQIAHDPAFTGLHMEGDLPANMRTMIASGRAVEDVIGAFAKFICTEKLFTPAIESAACLQSVEKLANPRTWMSGAHEVVNILTLLQSRPALLETFEREVPRFGDPARKTMGYCDDIAEIRRSGERIIEWYESLSANDVLRQQLFKAYRIYLIGVIADVKARQQNQVKSPGSWAHTMQSHIDRLAEEKNALMKPENHNPAIPTVHSIPAYKYKQITHRPDRMDWNTGNFHEPVYHDPNLCLTHGFERALDKYRDIYRNEFQEIQEAIDYRSQELTRAKTLSPVTFVYIHHDDNGDFWCPRHPDKENVSIRCSALWRIRTDFPISQILYPDDGNAKENKIYIREISGGFSVAFEKNELNHQHFAAELLGLGRIERKVKTSTALTLGTYFIAGNDQRKLLMSETWPVAAPDAHTTPAILTRLFISKDLLLHRGEPLCNTMGISGTVSSLVLNIQGKKGRGVVHGGSLVNSGEHTQTFPGDDDLEYMSELKNRIDDTLLKKQRQYLDETLPSSTLDDTHAYLLHIYLYFTVGPRHQDFAALRNFSVWTYNAMLREATLCKSRLDNQKVCEDLVSKLENSLASLNDDEKNVARMMQKTITEEKADTAVVHGMDTVRHGLLRLRLFEQKHCRQHASQPKEVDASRKECMEIISGSTTAHETALCDSIFRNEAELIRTDRVVTTCSQEAASSMGFFGRLSNWLTTGNSCPQIAEVEATVSHDLVS